jgi:hypothetical protein
MSGIIVNTDYCFVTRLAKKTGKFKPGEAEE